jgi:hypothetical protein
VVVWKEAIVFVGARRRAESTDGGFEADLVVVRWTL